MTSALRLSAIPAVEPTVKRSFSLRKSTTTLLARYQQIYSKQQGCEVDMKDLVEQMLLDFMAKDAAFQKAIRESSPAEPKAKSADPAI